MRGRMAADASAIFFATVVRKAEDGMVGAGYETHPRSKTYAVRVLAILVGCLTVFIGVFWLMDISLAGFPDGAVTDYEKVVEGPFTILSLASVVVSLYFFYLAIIAARRRTFVNLFVAFILYLAVVPSTYYGIEYYLKNFTDINYGQGG
jgi:hypothetical protein